MSKDDPIPPASNSLSAMFARGETIQSIEEKVPEEHKIELRRLGVGAKPISTENGLVPPQAAIIYPKLQRGDLVFDREKELKVVVVIPELAFSRKGMPYHKVVHKQTGEAWIQSANKLRKL